MLIRERCQHALKCSLLPISLVLCSIAPAQSPRLVLIDQDGSGPGGSN